MSRSGQQNQFLEVLDREEAERRFHAALDLRPFAGETVSLGDCHGRVLAEDGVAQVDVPGFDRSDVDGFAVRAADTYGAQEERTVTLRLTGEVLTPGRSARRSVGAGEATLIATGAMLPRGADAVVMVEETETIGDRVRIQRAIAPGANVSFAGSDIARGETLLRRGQVITARESAILAALGIDQVSVVRRPHVAILSTGDEIVAPGQAIQPGQIFDSNATVLAHTVRELGGIPHNLGIARDNLDVLREKLSEALQYDMVLLSGGTSKGEGDLSYRAVAELGPPGVLVHGVALKPGKPLCLAVAGTKPVAVLPGFPASAIFTFREFLGPILRRWGGLSADDPRVELARLPMRLNSARGRTEYALVHLAPITTGGDLSWSAYPVGKGSGAVTAFSLADGYVTIPRQREYLEAGEVVPVRMLAPDVRPADLVVIGSHCVGLDWLISELIARGFHCKVASVGSWGGIRAVERGECDIAGVHLLDEATGVYNRPMTPVNASHHVGYARKQGLVYRQEDARFQGKTLDEAIAQACSDPAVRMVNRNRGSGTRVLVDQLLTGQQPPGYFSEAKSHGAVANAVFQGRADWGLAIETVAKQYGLAFIPYRDEEYDFVIPLDRLGRPAVRAFLQILQEPATADRLSEMGFSRPVA